jgi:type IV secretion system protein VirB10
VERLSEAEEENRQVERAKRIAAALNPGANGQGGGIQATGNQVASSKGTPLALNGPVRSLEGDSFLMLGGGPGPRYRVPEGRFLDCVITHKVEGSNNESPVVAMVTRDYVSPDGKWVLFPAGSTVLGVQGLVQAQQQTRLFIRMHRMLLPNETSLYFPERLQPQALNPDGSIGVEGSVNRHFWLQFGAAVCLGVVDGLSAAYSTSSSSSGTVTISTQQYATGKVSDRLSQVTEKILDKYANVVPTITLKNGQRMKVYFSEDVLVNGYMPTSQLNWVGHAQ